MADNVTLPGTGGVVATDDIGGVQYQRVKPAWGVDGVAGDVTATNPLPTSMNASIFRFSSNNTSSAQLASNATFTGVIETALDQPSISLLLVSDQPITLTVKQYIDAGGTQAVPDIIYYVAANQGLSASFALNGNYVNVTAKNTGTATTTTFSLNTAYGSLPSSDGSGRLPVANADCVQLLSQTFSAAGTSSNMDTAGYGTVVVQLGGVWQGNGYFEGSNTGLSTDWHTVMSIESDDVSLRENVTGSGVYVIRPNGRYLRFVLTAVVGTVVLTAVGRVSQATDASDRLSLAMDKANNAPLYTELSDTTVSKIAQPAMALIGEYRGFGVIPINQVLCVVDCVNYSSLLIQTQIGTTGNISGQWSNDGAVWSSNANWIDTATSAAGTTATTGVGFKATPVYARYFRLVMSLATTGTLPTYALVYGNRATITPVIGLSTSLGSITNVAAVSAINASGATNGTTVGTLVSAASNNLTQIKGSLGRIYFMSAVNTTASIQYLKLFALPSASVTMGTTSATLNFAIPANGILPLEINDLGLCIGGTGISFAITTGSSLTDNTATTAGAVLLNYAYA